MTKAIGHIWFDDSAPITYTGTGERTPRMPWKYNVEPDPVNPQLKGSTTMSASSYEDAARRLAKELAWRDPQVLKLRKQAKALEGLTAQAEYDRLMALRPTDGEYEPDYEEDGA